MFNFKSRKSAPSESIPDLVEDTNNNITEEEKSCNFAGYGTSIIGRYDVNKGKRVISKEGRLETYKSWVYGTVNLIANSVSEVPLNLYAIHQKGKELANFDSKALTFDEKMNTKSLFTGDDVDLSSVASHPAAQLINKANDYLDGFNLMYLTETYIDLYGDAYWYVAKDKDDVPQEIHPLNPTDVSIITDKKMTRVLGYNLQTQDGYVRFKKDEIVHFKYVSPYNRFYGESPLRGLATPVTKIALSNQLEESVLRNGGMPIVLLKSKKELTSAEIRQIENQFQKATNNGKQGGVKALNNYLEVETLNYSLQELMLTDSQVWDLKNICFSYGVPYSLVDSSDQKKAGLDEAMTQMAINCVIPRLRRIEQTLNQQYLPLFDPNLKFKFSDPTPENEMDKSKVIETYVKNGIITIDEARSIIGL
jgi:HK97 family phage portal protein